MREPGSPGGPCLVCPRYHYGCEQRRYAAALICARCGAPLGYGRAYDYDAHSCWHLRCPPLPEGPAYAWYVAEVVGPAFGLDAEPGSEVCVRRHGAGVIIVCGHAVCWLPMRAARRALSRRRRHDEQPEPAADPVACEALVRARRL